MLLGLLRLACTAQVSLLSTGGGQGKKSAAEAVQAMAAENEAIKPRIAGAGAIRPLVHMVRDGARSGAAHREDARLSGAGRRALQAPARSSWGQEASSQLRTCAGNLQQQAAAAGALRALASCPDVPVVVRAMETTRSFLTDAHARRQPPAAGGRSGGAPGAGVLPRQPRFRARDGRARRGPAAGGHACAGAGAHAVLRCRCAVQPRAGLPRQPGGAPEPGSEVWGGTDPHLAEPFYLNPKL